MRHTGEWVSAEPLITRRLQLEPLREAHADEAEPLLRDPALYAFTGGDPLTAEELRKRYLRQSAGRSPDGSQGWLNWMARSRSSAHLVGTVQATLSFTDQNTTPGDDAELLAELAWIVGTGHQGQGYATESARAVKHWLELVGVHRFAANIHPEHVASQRVAKNLGLAPSDLLIDGEVRWVN